MQLKTSTGREFCRNPLSPPRSPRPTTGRKKILTWITKTFHLVAGDGDAPNSEPPGSSRRLRRKPRRVSAPPPPPPPPTPRGSASGRFPKTTDSRLGRPRASHALLRSGAFPDRLSALSFRPFLRPVSHDPDYGAGALAGAAVSAAHPPPPAPHNKLSPTTTIPLVGYRDPSKSFPAGRLFTSCFRDGWRANSS